MGESESPPSNVGSWRPPGWMLRDARPCPIHDNGSNSPREDLGWLGCRLAELCLAESYLPESMGNQDARHRTERDTLLLTLGSPVLYLTLRRADFLLRSLGRYPDGEKPRIPPSENFLPINCGRLGPGRKGLGYLTPSDQLKTPQDLYLMILRGNPDSCALLPGLLNKRNKIGDVITSLLVVLKILHVWGFLKRPSHTKK